MKKLLLILSFLLVISATSTFAQTRLGGGISYGTEVEEFGLNLNGEFFLTNKVAISPELNYFFIEGNSSFWTLNGDGHFFLSGSSAAALYALAGLNLTTQGAGDNSNTELGVNLGIGANLDLNSAVLPFIQFKYIMSEYNQAVLSFGIRVGI